MKEIKVHGIVLREDPMGDKDKRLVLLSAEMGKLTILAKGALGVKSKFRSLCSQFCFGEYILTKGKTFYYIKEGTLAESFYELRTNIDRLAYGSFMLEVAEEFSLEGQENRDLLEILFRGLKMETLCQEGMESIPADVTVFRILAQNGYYPELARCRFSEGPEDPDHVLNTDDSVFLPGTGSVCCARCARSGRAGAGVRLSPGALAALRYSIEQPSQKAYAFTVSDEVRRQIHEAVTDYLVEQTEHTYTSLGFIAKITSAP